MISNYAPYMPSLLERWREDEDFAGVAEELKSMSLIHLAIFCSDIYNTSSGVDQAKTDLALLSVQFVKDEHSVKGAERLLGLIDRWNDTDDTDEWDKVAQDLVKNNSRSDIVIFISNLYSTRDHTNGLFQTGFLSGALSKHELK